MHIMRIENLFSQCFTKTVETDYEKMHKSLCIFHKYGTPNLYTICIYKINKKK